MARGSGRINSSGAVSHSPRAPVWGSGVSVKTVVVGSPSASRPPITYTVPDTWTTLASVRGSGRSGPGIHRSKLPTPDSWATETVDCAAEPSVPPMYRRLVPSCAAAPSVRGAGTASSVGDSCQGAIAPTGAGHGRLSLPGGQRLIGDHAMTPRSTVQFTVR